MKKLVLLLALTISCSIFAQEQEIDPELREVLESLSPEALDSLENALNAIMRQQIQSIGGIPFGISKEEALPKLRNKYGEPSRSVNNNTITFNNIKYAGHDFSDVHFLFESDGDNTFLYACIFIKSAKNRNEVNLFLKQLKDDLEEKYDIFSYEDNNGFPIYKGGISPLWDGNLLTLEDALLTGWHTDVIEYNNNLVELYGYKYGVRLIYGPYEYVKEEF